MAIGDNVKAIRTEKTLTQEKLAEQMGISRSYLSDIERNRKNPSSKTIKALAEKLDVSMLYLTTGNKTIKDLSDNELQEQFKAARDKFKVNVKDDIKQLLDAELTFAETAYISNMIQFLRLADSKDIASVASIIRTLINSVEYKNADDADKDELNEFLKSELEDITKFFHDYFFNENIEGD